MEVEQELPDRTGGSATEFELSALSKGLLTAERPIYFPGESTPAETFESSDFIESALRNATSIMQLQREGRYGRISPAYNLGKIALAGLNAEFKKSLSQGLGVLDFEQLQRDEEDRLLQSIFAGAPATGRVSGIAALAQGFRAERVRASAPLRALLATVRSDVSTWERVSGFMARTRDGDYVDTGATGRNRVFSPLFAGIYTADPTKLEVALDAAVQKDGEMLQNGQYFPTVVVGSGPSASVFVAARREAKPDEPVLVVDEGARLGGQFSMARRPLFRLNSRNRPTDGNAQNPLPGDKGNLNALSPGVVEVSDLDSTVYPTQNVLGIACALNTYLNSSLVSAETKLVGVLPNRDSDRSGRYKLFLEKDGSVRELSTDRLVIGAGLGREKYTFGDTATDELIEQERSADRPRILTYDDFQRVVGDATRQFPLADFKDKRVAVVGSGDSAKTVIETLLGLQVRAGDSVSQADQVEKIVWYGQENTTKEELCDALRARYGLIALNAPRDNANFESRIEIISDKARAIAVEGSGLMLTSEDDDEDLADIVVIAKGYQTDVESILQGIGRPVEIDGSNINGNVMAQSQLARGLMPGSLIKLAVGDTNASVELVPAIDGQRTLRYTINGQRFDRTYDMETFSTELQKVVSSGRVISVEAISNGEFANGSSPVGLAEKKIGEAQLRNFIRQQQARGNVVYNYGQGTFEELPEKVADLQQASLRTQNFFPDFFTTFATGVDNTRVSVAPYLNDADGGATSSFIGLPPMKEGYDRDLTDDIVRELRSGETDLLRQQLTPGFGISFETRQANRNTYIITAIEDGVVSYLDQLRSYGRGDTSPNIFQKEVQAFLTDVQRLYRDNIGAYNYTTIFRFVDVPENLVLTSANRPAIESTAVVPSGPGGEVLRSKENGSSAVFSFIKAETDKGNETLVYDSDNATLSQYKLLPNDEVLVIRQGLEDLDFFAPASGVSKTTETVGSVIENITNTAESIVFSLPPGQGLPEAQNERFKELFKTGNTAELAPQLQPGFAVRYERYGDTLTYLVTARNGDQIEYVDIDDFYDFGGAYLTRDDSIDDFIENIFDDFLNGDSDEYRLSVRLPAPLIEAINKTEQKEARAKKVKSIVKNGSLSIPASRVELSEQVSTQNGERTAIAKTVFGEDVYIIGPAARLPYSDREERRLSALGLRENAEAIFRYAPRNRELAELLPSRGSRSERRADPAKAPIVVAAETRAKYTARLTATKDAVATAVQSVALPYDVDTQEMTAYALVAALQNRVSYSGSKPYTMILAAKEQDDEISFTASANGLSQASIVELQRTLVADNLFLAAFSKQVQATPKAYNRQITFELTPNGVNPYSVTIQNVRNKATRISYPTK